MNKITRNLTAINLLILFFISNNAIAQPKVELPAGVPRNIVIIVGNGMGISHISAAELKNKDTLTLERFPAIGLMKTWSANQVITDPFASMTAIACGKKTNNGFIGIGTDNKPMMNLFEWAKKRDMSTGVVTTSSITRTSLLPFLLHKESLESDEKMALTLTETYTDIIIAGGNKYFRKRDDKMDLLNNFRAKSYSYDDNIKNVGKLRAGRLLALVSDEDIPGGSFRKGFLPKASANAMQMLMINTKGYFLVIENSHIQNAIASNATQAMADEVIDMDKAVNEVLKLTGNQTLVLVLGNVEYGGVTVTGGSKKDGKSEINSSIKGNTATMVPVFAFGPGSENFSGIYDNSDVFIKLLEFIDINR